MEHESRSNSLNFENHEPKSPNIELNDFKNSSIFLITLFFC